MNQPLQLEQTSQKSERRWDPLKPQRRLAYLFLSPWFLGFVLLNLYPIVSSFYFSFMRHNLVKPPKYVGLKHYMKILSPDKTFIRSVNNSLYLLFVGVTIQLAFSIFCAVLLHQRVRGRGFYRTAWYLPTLVSPAAASLVWLWLLNPEYGLVNAFLRFFGLPQPLWLLSAEWSKPAIILMGLWTAGTTIIVYLSGMGEIPRDYYESMDLDGANSWTQFWHITWPMLSGLTLFQIINGVIASFNAFTATYIIAMANRKASGSLGGYKDSLLFYAVNIYNNAFNKLHFGYASALAVLMFVFVLLITLILFKTTRKWVNYDA
ncbi:MAG: sugar ABC transporter permease [Eubacteriales bacterium]|nr:sugar ABC transporter permease [Eubacteriales bacterium]